MQQLELCGDVVIALESVTDEFALIGSVGTHEELLQARRGARGQVVVQDDALPGWTAGPHHDVVVGTGRLVAAQDLQRRLIDMHERRGE
jgi:hypothetical protein